LSYTKKQLNTCNSISCYFLYLSNFYFFIQYFPFITKHWFCWVFKKNSK